MPDTWQSFNTITIKTVIEVGFSDLSSIFWIWEDVISQGDHEVRSVYAFVMGMRGW